MGLKEEEARLYDEKGMTYLQKVLDTQQVLAFNKEMINFIHRNNNFQLNKVPRTCIFSKKMT